MSFVGRATHLRSASRRVDALFCRVASAMWGLFVGVLGNRVPVGLSVMGYGLPEKKLILRDAQHRLDEGPVVETGQGLEPPDECLRRH